MILPTKRIDSTRALLAIGSEILDLLQEPKTVSRLWEDHQKLRSNTRGKKPVSFDWFILSLDLLNIVNAIYTERGRIHKNVK